MLAATARALAEALEKLPRDLNVLDYAIDDDSFVLWFRDIDGDSLPTHLTESAPRKLTVRVTFRLPDKRIMASMVAANGWNSHPAAHGTFSYVTKVDQTLLIVLESNLLVSNEPHEIEINRWLADFFRHINPFEDFLRRAFNDFSVDDDELLGRRSNLWRFVAGAIRAYGWIDDIFRD